MSPPTPDHLGAAIRQAREKRGGSIEDLAAKAGISWRYLSDIELGEDRNPTWVVVGSIASALGMEISELAKLAEDLAAADGSG